MPTGADPGDHPGLPLTTEADAGPSLGHRDGGAAIRPGVSDARSGIPSDCPEPRSAETELRLPRAGHGELPEELPNWSSSSATPWVLLYLKKKRPSGGRKMAGVSTLSTIPQSPETNRSPGSP